MQKRAMKRRRKRDVEWVDMIIGGRGQRVGIAGEWAEIEFFRVAFLPHSPLMTNSTSSATTPVVPSEVGWQFVPQYYTFVNKQPNRLHCFYTKASTFIHGTEGEDGKPCFGQQVCLSFLSPTHLSSLPGNPQQDHLHRLPGLQGFYPLRRCTGFCRRWHHHPGHR